MKNVIIQESAFAAHTSSVKKLPSGCIEFITVLQEADRPNRNGRVYPKAVLEKALNSAYVRERIATKTFYSEAGHPLDPSASRQLAINHSNIACIVTEFWWEGNLLKGRVETANTAVGRDMAGLIEQGSKVAFSLRAQGNVHKNPVTGLVEVEDGLMIFAYDWVINPSHDKAFMERICEATIKSLYKTTRNNLTASILCEAEDLFNNGNIYDPANEVEETEFDYTADYTPKFKKVEDMYLPEPEDKVLSIGENTVIIRNNETHTIKKVLTEDFLVKDIRNKIGNLKHAVSVDDFEVNLFNKDIYNKETEPVKNEDCVEVNLDNKDVYPADEHKNTEEVNGVIVESKEA